MSDKAINTTEDTKIVSYQVTENESGQEDVTAHQIVRLFGMTPEDYKTRGSDYILYDDYTLYLVKRSIDINHTSSSDTAGEGIEFTDLYYGDKKITDLIVIDSDKLDSHARVAKDTIGNPEYPDDKMYLVAYHSDEVIEISGQSVPHPIGYNIYFKHNGIVTPVSSSFVKEISYNETYKSVNLVFTSSSGDDIPVRILSDESLYQELKALPEDTIESLLNQLDAGIKIRYVVPLQNAILNETREREKADQSLSDRISKEVEDREVAVDDLLKKLDSEISRSEDKDTSHDNALSSETKARQNADTDLQIQINNLMNQINNINNQLTLKFVE